MEPSWLGQRISVRRALERRPDGQVHFGDVVGDLVGLDAQTAVVETRAGLVEIPRELVAVARLAPPSTADELALERVAARGMRPAETAELGGWLLRADHGLLRRTNSVLPLRAPGMPLPDALERAREWYAERGLPLLIACPTEARRLLEADLGERGWEVDTAAYVMTARLDRLPSATPSDAVELLDEPDADWLAMFRGGKDPVTARATLTRHPDARFAVHREDGRVLAIGRGAVDDGWLGVSAVEVAPQARRRGLATAVMRALVSWGTERGATRSYLQVEDGNDPAFTLYDALGYRVHHAYRYRRAPAGDL